MEIREALEKIGYSNLKDTNGWFRTRPLYRSSDNDTVLVINKTTGYWYDYKIAQGGKLAELVRLSLDLASIDDADIYLKECLQFTPPVKDPDKTEIKQVKIWPPELLNKLVKDYTYWNKRGVNDETLSYFNGGVAIEGRMKDRFIFPIYSPEGKIIGFSGRWIAPTETTMKWKHLGPTKEWVYPAFFSLREGNKDGSVFLVESIGDMLALWQAGIKNVLVVFGLNLSGKIISYLLAHKIERVIIAFNNDSAKNFAGNEGAEKAKRKLLTFFDPDAILIRLPNKKDFGEMSLEEIQEYIKNV